VCNGIDLELMAPPKEKAFRAGFRRPQYSIEKEKHSCEGKDPACGG
jgi:hypothetical protein